MPRPDSAPTISQTKRGCSGSQQGKQTAGKLIRENLTISLSGQISKEPRFHSTAFLFDPFVVRVGAEIGVMPFQPHGFKM